MISGKHRELKYLTMRSFALPFSCLGGAGEATRKTEGDVIGASGVNARETRYHVSQAAGQACHSRALLGIVANGGADGARGRVPKQG